MNRKWMSVIFIVLFLTIIAIMDYPFVMRLIYKQEQTLVVMDYNTQVNELEESGKAQYLEAARQYNESIASVLGQNLTDPFETSELQNELQVVATIRIPVIDVSLPIYNNTSEAALAAGAGVLEGTSIPVGGMDTHACIAAHRGLRTKRMFTNLDQIEDGDLFFIYVMGETLAYQVNAIEIVTPETIEPLMIKKGMDMVTLITCTPYGVNTHRIYIHGIRIPYEDADVLAQTAVRRNGWRDYWWMILSVVLLIWLAGLLCWNRRRCRRALNNS